MTEYELSPEEERTYQNGWKNGVGIERERILRKLRDQAKREAGGELTVHLHWSELRRLVLNLKS